MRLGHLLLNGGSGDDGKTVDGGGGAGDQTPATVSKEAHDAALRELEALREQTATLAASIEEGKRKAAEDERKRREADGDILPLYEQTKADLTNLKQAKADLEAKVTEYEKREAARTKALDDSNKARTKALPEDIRDLIPEGLSGEVLANHLAALESRVAQADSKIAVGGRVGGGKKVSDTIPAECIRQAEEKGADPQWWFDNVYKPKQTRKGAA